MAILNKLVKLIKNSGQNRRDAQALEQYLRDEYGLTSISANQAEAFISRF